METLKLCWISFPLQWADSYIFTLQSWKGKQWLETANKLSHVCWICDRAASETVASRTSFRFVTTCSHLHLPWLCCIKVTIKRQSICNRMGSSCNFKRSCDNVEIVWEWLESDCGCLETGCLLPGIANFAVTTHLMQKNPTIFPNCKEDATLFLL